MQPSVTHSVVRVQAWLAQTDMPRSEIASKAEVDEKTLRLALKQADSWNPTADTLRKLEALIPPAFMAKPGKAA